MGGGRFQRAGDWQYRTLSIMATNVPLAQWLRTRSCFAPPLLNKVFLVRGSAPMFLPAGALQASQQALLSKSWLHRHCFPPVSPPPPPPTWCRFMHHYTSVQDMRLVVLT